MAGHQILVIKKNQHAAALNRFKRHFVQYLSLIITDYELFFSVTISKCELCKTFKPEMHGIGKTDKEHKY